jgi:hypothetical protein
MWRRVVILASALAVVAGTAIAFTGFTPAGASTSSSTSSVTSSATNPRFQVDRWSTPTYDHKYSQSITSEQFSTPAVTYMGSGKIPEVIAGFPNGHVYVWGARTGNRWLDRYIGPGAVQASPTIVDLNHDGQPDIVATDTSGDVVGFTLGNKTIFRAHTGVGPHQFGNFATTAVADLNGDGHLDIIQAGWDHYVHVWDGRYLNPTKSTRQLPGYPAFLKDTIWSSPVIADLNHDGIKDIIVGYDCDGVQGQPCYKIRDRYQRGGYVTALNGAGANAGKPLPGWPRFVNGQTIWSSPAVTDLNHDGKLDVVVGTGNMLDGGHEILAYDRTGKFLPGWPVKVAGRPTGSPAIGDLDHNGNKEVAVTDDNGYLYVINADGHIRYKKCISNTMTNCSATGPRIHGSASIANFTGLSGGRQEVLVGGEQHMYVFDNNGALAFSGMLWWTDRKVRSLPYMCAPTYANIDGKAKVFVAAGDFTFGEVFAWTLNQPYVHADWPTFHHDMERTGIL